MALSVRPTNPATDLSRIAEIVGLCDPAPVTVAQLKRMDQHLRHGQLRASSVAVSDDGHIIGYTTVHHGLWMAAGHFYLWVAVDPAAQGQGIGARLYGHSLAFALANGAKSIDTEVREQDDISLHFAQHRGFTFPGHLVQQEIDPHNVSASAFEAIHISMAGFQLRPGRHRLTKQLIHPSPGVKAPAAPGS